MPKLPGRQNLDQEFYRLVGEQSKLEMLESFSAPRPSWKERLEAGKAIRKRVPRTEHAHYRPAHRRQDPIALIEAQNATRVPKLVPVRMARMADSPFAFLRGSAAVMAADLAKTASTDLPVMACGDMHMANFGVFASAERNLVFAINDFDEVHPGHWEWDLKRLAASAAVAALHLGGDRKDGEAAAQAVVRSYVSRMRRYSEMGYMEVWYDLIDEDAILAICPPRLRKRVDSMIAKARAKGHMRSLEQMTETVDGENRFVEDVPIIVRETHRDDGMPMAIALDNGLRSYLQSLGDERKRLFSRYRIVDVVRKIVGVGSVGLNCWVLLMQGRDGDDPLFIQVKEARPSVLAPYMKLKMPWTSHGRRVVMGQRMIQGSPDIFLGWGQGDDRHQFYVRQLADMKGSLPFEAGDEGALDALPDRSSLCGWGLALAHAKSGDPAMISGYCGQSDSLAEAVGRFALAYLDQTVADHDRLVKAIRSGRLDAASAQEAGLGQ